MEVGSRESKMFDRKEFVVTRVLDRQMQISQGHQWKLASECWVCERHIFSLYLFH